MFGMGFSEIMIILIIAILFLGPDKLPSAMVDIAKFFRNVKNTVGTVKDSIEQEMNVSEIKEEALAYKKELLEASEKVSKVTNISSLNEGIASLGDDFVNTSSQEEEKLALQEKIKKMKEAKKEEQKDV
jgi:sec-independent protein translocase protein TatB